MKKLLFFIIMIVSLSGCYGIYETNRYHPRYYQPRKIIQYKRTIPFYTYPRNIFRYRNNYNNPRHY